MLKLHNVDDDGDDDVGVDDDETTQILANERICMLYVFRGLSQMSVSYTYIL